MALAAASPAQRGSAAAPREVNRIVAVVNSDVILMSELSDRVRTVRRQMRQSGARPPPLQVLEQQILDQMILDRLQLQIAKRNGIRVDEEMLNRAVASIARNNKLGLVEFRNILERDGYEFAKFREDIRRQILISRVQQRSIGDRIRVRRKEVDNYLAAHAADVEENREYRIAQILIAVPDAATPEQIEAARERARKIVEKLRAGADFAQTAIAASDGQQAAAGGDLGWRKADRLPSLFAAVVPTLNKGDLHGPIQSPSGFHIIKLTDVRGDEKYIVNQTLVQQILIKTNEVVSDDDARSRLEQLRERILEGADFGALARANSDDKGSAVKDGRLGWVSPGDLVPEFERVMNALAPSEVSRPFKTQFGWHIAQVLERRQHDSTEQVRRAKAMDRLRKRKMDEERQAWLRQLRDEAYVEIKLDQ